MSRNRLTVVGLGGSLARRSNSLAALRALQGAAEAGATTELLDIRQLSIPMLILMMDTLQIPSAGCVT